MKYEDMNFQYVRYKLENLQIIAGSNDPFPVPDSMVVSVYLEKDFDNTYFPYFEIDLNLPYWVYANMVDNQQKTYLSLTLQYGFFPREVTSATVPMTTEFSGKYRCVFSDLSPDLKDAEVRKLEKENQTLNVGYSYTDQIVVQMLLFNDSFFNGYDKQVNAVLSSTNLLNALTYVLNQAGLNQILLSPPNNSRNYSEFRITPIDAIHQIDRICNQYAMHTNGTVIFLDIDRGYIIAKKPDCDAFVNNEWKNTNLVCLDTYNFSSLTAGGQYRNSEEKTNVINILADSIFTYDKTAQQTTAFKVVDTTNGSVSSQNTGAGRPNRTTYIYNQGADSGASLANAAKENAKILVCSLRNCTINALSPNKCMVVTIENPKFKSFSGKYRVAKMSCHFEREGIYYNPFITIELHGG